MLLPKFSNYSSYLISSTPKSERKIDNIVARTLFEEIVIGGHVDYFGRRYFRVGVCRSKGLNRGNDKDDERECDYPSRVALKLDSSIASDSWWIFGEILNGVYFLSSGIPSLYFYQSLVIRQYYIIYHLRKSPIYN